jgi:ribosomal protein L7/L12
MKVSLQNFFLDLKLRGDDLVRSMQDLSDVCADDVLKEHPAVVNLLRKIQYTMDRAAAAMRHTETEQSDIEESIEDARHENVTRIRAGDDENAVLRRQVETLAAQVPTKDGLTEHERKLVESGDFVEAVKQYRYRLAIGIKEAKDFVEQYRDTHHTKQG